MKLRTLVFFLLSFSSFLTLADDQSGPVGVEKEAKESSELSAETNARLQTLRKYLEEYYEGLSSLKSLAEKEGGDSIAALQFIRMGEQQTMNSYALVSELCHSLQRDMLLSGPSQKKILVEKLIEILAKVDRQGHYSSLPKNVTFLIISSELPEAFVGLYQLHTPVFSWIVFDSLFRSVEIQRDFLWLMGLVAEHDLPRLNILVSVLDKVAYAANAKEAEKIILRAWQEFAEYSDSEQVQVFTRTLMKKHFNAE